MAKLSPAIILVKDIHCDVAKQQYSEEKLEVAAQLILDIEGIISPIIVRREGIEHYQLIHGAFEYHAAMRAREIDAIRGESIDAYIVDTENQETIQKQVQVFREHQQPNEQVMNVSGQQLESLLKSCLQPVMDRLTTIETQLSIKADEMPQHKPQNPIENIVQQEDVKTDSIVESPAQEVKTPTLPPDNKQNATEISKAVSEPTHANTAPKTSESIPAYLQLINDLDSERLTEKFKQLSINKSITKVILENRPFESEKALSDIKGVAAKTVGKLQTLATLSDDISKPVVLKAKPSQKAVPPVVKEETKVMDIFLVTLNQMDKIELFFKVKRATNLNDNKINQLIDSRPYQDLSDIKAINKKQLEKIRSLLTE